MTRENDPPPARVQPLTEDEVYAAFRHCGELWLLGRHEEARAFRFMLMNALRWCDEQLLADLNALEVYGG